MKCYMLLNHLFIGEREEMVISLIILNRIILPSPISSGHVNEMPFLSNIRNR